MVIIIKPKNSNKDLAKSISLIIEKIKSTYDIDNSNILRLIELHFLIKDQYQQDMNISDLLKFLGYVMNYDEMQIWLIRKQIKNENVTLNEKLTKFFSLKSNEDILRLYNMEQNYNQNNLDNVKKMIKK